MGADRRIERRFSVLISEKDTPHANRTFVRVARDTTRATYDTALEQRRQNSFSRNIGALRRIIGRGKCTVVPLLLQPADGSARDEI